MKTKIKKKKRPLTNETRQPTRAKWLSLVGLLSALFVGAWLWMRRQTTPTIAATAQTDTTAKTDPADSITYMGSPMHEFNSNEFNPNEFA